MTGSAYPEKEWCVADEQTPDDILQQALDWACGYGGADCRMIQHNKPCYLPNNVRDHASYAFNNYWQKFKNKGGSCYFKSAAMITDLDPSKKVHPFFLYLAFLFLFFPIFCVWMHVFHCEDFHYNIHFPKFDYIKSWGRLLFSFPLFSFGSKTSSDSKSFYTLYVNL